MLFKMLLQISFLSKLSWSMFAFVRLNAFMRPCVVKEVPRSGKSFISIVSFTNINSNNRSISVCGIISDMFEIFDCGCLTLSFPNLRRSGWVVVLIYQFLTNFRILKMAMIFPKELFRIILPFEFSNSWRSGRRSYVQWRSFRFDFP